MPLSFQLNQMEKDFLSSQTQLAIESVLKQDAAASPESPENLPSDSALYRDLGSFVTLNRGHQLRGCIGTIIGREPLWQNVWNMARASAFEDPRFPPLQQQEWRDLSMEISVLDQPSLCPEPSKIVIGRDGLILRLGSRSGVFLPQVPVEQGWNLDQYLNHLCLKAGLPAGSWQKPDAQLYWYEALVFPAKAGAKRDKD